MALNEDKKYARRAVAKGKVVFMATEEPTETTREYLCEVCGKRETLTEADAYQNGWDYPPFIGIWGVVSPRTCPSCPMTDTAYWTLIMQGQEHLTDKQRETITRIIAEPATEMQF